MLGYVTSVSVVVAVGGVIVASVVGLVCLSCCCRFCTCFHMLPFLPFPPWVLHLQWKKVLPFFNLNYIRKMLWFVDIRTLFMMRFQSIQWHKTRGLIPLQFAETRMLHPPPPPPPQGCNIRVSANCNRINPLQYRRVCVAGLLTSEAHVNSLGTSMPHLN